MSETPYIPFYTSDFLGGTSGMTASCKGVYITILCLIYEAEGPLKQKWDILARRCGCTLPAFKRAVSDLEDDGKLEVSEAGIWSPKCEKHLTQRRERQNSARSAAETRWGKTKQKQGKADAGAMRKQCQPEPEPDIKEEPKGSLSSGDDAQPFDEIAECVSEYNATARQAGWPEVKVLSKARRSALSQRLRECGGIEGWRHALAKARASPHCCGHNDRGWTANFDFLTRQSSFAKLMEGNYDNRAGKSNTGTDAAARQISYAARFGRSPSADCF